MTESPVRKKLRTYECSLKRRGDDDCSIAKRVKTEESMEAINSDSGVEDNNVSKQISNFVLACHEVVYNNFVDLKSRFLLKVLPRCVDPANCEHAKLEKSKILTEVPGYAVEAFNIDFKSHMWSDSIDICRNILRPGSYLPAEVLRNIMEIILNAHDDPASGFSLPYLIDRCRQTMFLIYVTNPPCVEKVRKSYKDFLTKPTTVKNSHLLTERKSNGYDEGLFTYCLNCLSNELQCKGEEALVQRDADQMNTLLQQSVKTMNLQKKKYEIYEALERPERIKRLITVLECLVGILEIDLAIWHSRHSHNPSKYIMRPVKPLITYVLWTNVLFTGAVSCSCKLILQLFIKFVELEYPDQYVDVMMRIVNVMVQTFYLCENTSESDYPNPGKYCSHLADSLFVIIRDLPIKVVNKVIDKIEPNFLKHMLGTKYLQLKLNTIENNILQISVDFLQKKIYSEFEDVETIEVEILSMKKPKTLRNFYSFFHKVTKANRRWLEVNGKGKINNLNVENVDARDHSINKEQIIYLLYITLKYYLDAFRIQDVHNLLQNHSSDDKEKNNLNPLDIPGPALSKIVNVRHSFDQCSNFTLSENFVKKYRSIFQMLQKLIVVFGEVKKSSDYVLFQNFVRISILEL